MASPPPSSYSATSPLLSRIQRQIASPSSMGFPFGGAQGPTFPNPAILAQYQAMMEKLLGTAGMLSPPGSESSVPSPGAQERSTLPGLSPSSQTLAKHTTSSSSPASAAPMMSQNLQGNYQGRTKFFSDGYWHLSGRCEKQTPIPRCGKI